MDAREIIDYIATSPKRTPVKAYVKEAAGAQVSYPQDAHVFGEGMSRIVFADWSSLAPVLEGRARTAVSWTTWSRAIGATQACPCSTSWA